ncbi:MAG: hypothetical protein AAFQ82_09910, partial [Myxococcota bacterium]
MRTAIVGLVLVLTACVDVSIYQPEINSSNDEQPPSAGCGNGTVDPGERCDGNCPTNCDDANACTADRLEGSAAACDARCVFEPITACSVGDGCCPEGCTSSDDGDCSDTCNDGVVDENETCDMNCPASCDDGIVCTEDISAGSA